MIERNEKESKLEKVRAANKKIRSINHSFIC